MRERISVNGSRGSGVSTSSGLYREEEVCAGFERSGLTVVGVFASPFGSRFEATSATMWIVAEQRGIG